MKAGDEGAPLRLEKESFLASHPDLLLKFGKDILPSLIQVCCLALLFILPQKIL